MDESTLQDQLDGIRRRQYLVLVLLVVPYLLLIAEYVGYWVAGVLGTAAGLLAVAVAIFYRRRAREATGPETGASQ